MAATASWACVLSSPKYRARCSPKRRFIVPKHCSIRNRRFEIGLSKRFSEALEPAIAGRLAHDAVSARSAGTLSARPCNPAWMSIPSSPVAHRDRRFGLRPRPLIWRQTSAGSASNTPPFTGALRNRRMKAETAQRHEIRTNLQRPLQARDARPVPLTDRKALEQDQPRGPGPSTPRSCPERRQARSERTLPAKTAPSKHTPENLPHHTRSTSQAAALHSIMQRSFLGNLTRKTADAFDDLRDG